MTITELRQMCDLTLQALEIVNDPEDVEELADLVHAFSKRMLAKCKRESARQSVGRN